jgi:hypothetical protein
VESNWLPVGDALGSAIENTIAGKSDAQSALNQAQIEIKKINSPRN